MTRSVPVVLLAAFAMAATADASPRVGALPATCTGNCSPVPKFIGASPADRATFLAIGGTVSIAFVAGDTVELVRTGKPNATLCGFGMIAEVPILLWGVNTVSQNSGDKASWTVTIAASGMVAYGLWPVVDRYVLGHNNDDEPAKARAHAFHAGPTVVVGPSDAAGAGIGFGGSF